MFWHWDAQKIEQIEEDLQSAFLSKHESEMKEYIGNKVDVI
jgi:hypothetical protein